MTAAPSQLRCGQEIDFQEFQRQQNGDDWNNENDQCRPRRQVFDQPRQFLLELAPGNEIDDARDDGLEMIP